MKRLLSLIIAVGLMFGVAGNALAAFDRNDLVQVVYNENDNEVAINLGDISEIDFNASNQIISDPGSVSLTQFDTIDTWEDLSLAFFAGDNSTYQIWFATTKDTISGISSAGYTPFQSAATSLYSYFNTDGIDDGLFIGASATAGTNSYDERMNSNSTAPGYYSGFNNTDTSFGEADLAALVTDGFVDMYLYHYNGITLVNGANGSQYTAVLRYFADGSTVLNPITSPVPVPASVLLFGSGLLGLFGIRRKRA
ncbi:MAG: PEP-CTERM sorting domain-containing protein [Deltaproteobacteria bacterium]|nr:PEP-CTERM sorting domain-containing protein [Deltaproteobacteria bacterium]